MSDLIIPSSSVALPLPNANITIRPGVLADVPFLDSLQKLHTKQVGWMPRAQFEGKIKAGHVLVAEEHVGCHSWHHDATQAGAMNGTLPESKGTPVGYCIGNDQYYKRDDVGIIYQMNVLPGRQRSFVGAALLKAMFDRAAYGCKLFCCWCAQDIAANKFWEAMGFVPLAYRAGSRKKGQVSRGKGQANASATCPSSRARVHIFWQKRIRSGDVTTPWWFPSQTSGGSIREDRIVLPIPPGTHWSDAKPLVLPGSASRELNHEGTKGTKENVGQVLTCHDPQVGTERQVKTCPTKTSNRESAIANGQSGKTPAAPQAVVAKGRAPIAAGGLRFAPAAPVALAMDVIDSKPTSKPKPPRVKAKNDPRLVAAARELRDRWLEQVNSGALIAQGKYDVSRAISSTVQATDVPALPLIEAA